jgi:hypothetical protein
MFTPPHLRADRLPSRDEVVATRRPRIRTKRAYRRSGRHVAVGIRAVGSSVTTWHRRPVGQPTLDRGALPPGSLQEIGSSLHISLGVHDVEQEPHKVAVRGFQQVRAFESPSSPREIGDLLTEETWTQQRQRPGALRIGCERLAGLSGALFKSPGVASAPTAPKVIAQSIHVA